MVDIHSRGPPLVCKYYAKGRVAVNGTRDIIPPEMGAGMGGADKLECSLSVEQVENLENLIEEVNTVEPSGVPFEPDSAEDLALIACQTRILNLTLAGVLPPMISLSWARDQALSLVTHDRSSLFARTLMSF